MKRLMWLVLTLLMGVLTNSCGRRPSKSDVSTVSHPNFQLDRVVKSFEPLIFGKMTDPVLAAQRTWSYNRLITRSAQKYQVPVDKLRAVIFLESQGNRWAFAPGSGAAGLGQFTQATARGFGLTVDNQLAKRLLAKRRQAIKSSNEKWRLKLERELVQRDERFNPFYAIPASARYLARHHRDFGRWDFAIAAYHMGSGNVQKILKLICLGRHTWQDSAKQTILAHHLSWSKIVFEACPCQNPLTHRALWGLKDHSRDYWFRVLASERALKLWRANPAEFKKRTGLFKIRHHPVHPRRWELALEPQWYPVTNRWSDYQSLGLAYQTGELVRLPKNQLLADGIVLSPMGRYAGSEVDKSLYQGARLELWGLLQHIADRVRQESGDSNATVRVGSLVRSAALQKIFVAKGESPSQYSTHCLGVAADLIPPNHDRVKRALTYVLETLRWQGKIVWCIESDHYHLTINPSFRDKFLSLPPVEAQQKPRRRWPVLAWLIGLVIAWWYLGKEIKETGSKDSILVRLIPAVLWPVLLAARIYCRLKR